MHSCDSQHLGGYSETANQPEQWWESPGPMQLLTADAPRWRPGGSQEYRDGLRGLELARWSQCDLYVCAV